MSIRTRDLSDDKMIGNINRLAPQTSIHRPFSNIASAFALVCLSYGRFPSLTSSCFPYGEQVSPLVAANLEMQEVTTAANACVDGLHGRCVAGLDMTGGATKEVRRMLEEPQDSCQSVVEAEVKKCLGLYHAVGMGL